MVIRPTGAVLVSLFLLSSSLFAAPEPSRPYDPPIPTQEQRDALRKQRPQPRNTPTDRTEAQAELARHQEDVDVIHYFLDLEFDGTARTVTGAVTVTAESLATDLEHLVLDLDDAMAVTDVTLGGSSLAYAHADNLLDITLDRFYQPGERFDVRVEYGGTPQNPPGASYFGWNKYLWPSEGAMAWSLSEPDGASIWWPCKNRLDDKATATEWYTVQDTWTATGNGLLTGTTGMSGKRTRYEWEATHPMAPYLVSVAATRYVTYSESYLSLDGGTTMPVDYYVYPELLDQAQESFNRTVDMITFFAETFGEYPFLEDKYGNSTFPFGGGMEHPTNTSYGYTLVTGDHTYDWLNAHEIAHMWWGDSVGLETWADNWLKEGMCRHSEALWFENENGAQGYRDWMNSLWQEVFDGPVYDNPDLFGNTVYRKGAWVQHMLRGVMGDEAFFGTLRDWYEQRKDHYGNTVQYRQALEARYGSALDWFFDEWVYGSGSPRYEYGWTTADLGGSAYRNYVRIHQVQSDAGLFIMPVQLTLLTASGEEIRTVWNDALDQDFLLDTDEPLTDLRFDEKDWILKASVEETVLDDADGDGVPDRNDNCPWDTNPVQADADGDEQGDVCDGDDDDDLLDDPDDCAPFDPEQGRPAEVERLDIDDATLYWTAAPRADGYDISRGDVGALSAGSYGSCIQEMLPGTSWEDPETPPAGEGWVYLVRGRDTGCGGGGSMGSDSAGSERGTTCP